MEKRKNLQTLGRCPENSFNERWRRKEIHLEEKERRRE